MRALPFGLVLAVLAATAAFAKAPDLRFETPESLPALTFETADGESRTLEDYRGQVVVLNLWATWCAPCKVEMPTLARLQEALEGEGVRVLALAVERTDPEKLEAALDELGASNLELLRDPGMDSLRALGVRGIPVTLVIDKQGREVFRHLGDAAWNAPGVIEALKALAAGDGLTRI